MRMSVVDVAGPQGAFKRTLEFRQSYRVDPRLPFKKGCEGPTVNIREPGRRANAHIAHRFAKVDDETALSFVDRVCHAPQRPATIGANIRRIAERSRHGLTVGDAIQIPDDPVRGPSNFVSRFGRTWLFVSPFGVRRDRYHWVAP